MIKAMEDKGEALVSGIARKTEHLNVIGNISPMMGLLGTVIGMLRCFNEIAHMTGAIEPKQLAAGIFEALVTTCMGLIVAIPALYCYAVFKNRVDEFAGEAAMKAEQLVSGFKPTGGMS
jgi:biopolymer transport protein ExbB